MYGHLRSLMCLYTLEHKKGGGGTITAQCPKDVKFSAACTVTAVTYRDTGKCQSASVAEALAKSVPSYTLPYFHATFRYLTACFILFTFRVTTTKFYDINNNNVQLRLSLTKFIHMKIII